MTIPLWKLGFTLLVIAFSAYCAVPCSLVYIPPSRFDIAQYMFVAQVTGYVETTELVNRRQSAGEGALYGDMSNKTSGVVVKVKQSFYTPTGAKPTYEIYRFSLGADCGLYGLAVDWMKERYKVGDWVRVVAGKADHIAGSKDPQIGRLEFRYGHDDGISVLKENDPLLNNIGLVYDYKSYRTTLIGDPTFELLKDLRRLSLANLDERRAILDRLTYYPRWCENCTFYLEQVFKDYSTDMDDFNAWAELVRKRGWTDDEFHDYQKRVNP